MDESVRPEPLILKLSLGIQPNLDVASIQSNSLFVKQSTENR